MSFQTQIEDLAGINLSADTTALNDYLTATAREVADALPANLLIRNATVATDTSNPFSVANMRILNITRNGRYANEIPYGMSAATADSGSIFFTDSNGRDPVFYYKGSDLYVLPAPDSDDPIHILRFAYPSVTYSASDITSFPDNAEYAVVLGATCKLLIRMISDAREALPATLSISDLSIISVAPALPAVPSFTTPDIASITILNIGVAPVYTSPTTTISNVTWVTEYPDSEVDLTTAFASIVTNVDLANGVFDVLPVVPAVPIAPSFTTPAIGTITISNVGTPPVYTAPVVGGDATELSSLDDLDADDTIDVHTDQPEWDQWFATATHLIEGEEDVELASAQIQKINSYIQAYSGAMQNQLNVFNDANTEYQAKLQEAVQQAQINAQEAQQETGLLLQQEQQEYAATLQKYSAEIQNYQAKVGAVSAQGQGYLQTAQGYSNEIQARLSATQTKIAEYQAKVQDALNSFNDANVEYQAKLQEAIQQAQINAQEAQQESSLKLQKENQEYGANLQKFSAEVGKYQADVSKEVQEYQNNMQQKIQELTANIQLQQAEIQTLSNQYQACEGKYQQELTRLSGAKAQ